MKQIKNQAKGFTIIEVVLVLAIAGLIFLMVFIALPALQRNQRDTQRREDISRFMSQVEQYRTNNRGKVPLADVDPQEAFITSYLRKGGDSFQDPNGEPYSFGGTTQASADGSEYAYNVGAKCDGEEISTVGASARQVAIVIELEGSGYYCQSNQ